jgi:hypothetical protein
VLPGKADYLTICARSEQAFLAANPAHSIIGWFPLPSVEVWRRGHSVAMQTLAAAGFGTNKMASASSIESAVLAAVISAICPPLTLFSGAVADVALYIVRELMSSLAKELATGPYGSTPEEFGEQMNEWSADAAKYVPDEVTQRLKVQAYHPAICDRNSSINSQTSAV